MGLNLRRTRFRDWVEDYGFGPDSRAVFLERLERHVGRKIDSEAWQVEDDAYPKVGSYTSYGVFLDCLRYVTEGDYQETLEKDEDIEWEALRGFREQFPPASLNIPYAAHFLETGDSDTIFIPLLFDPPFSYDDRYVASLPGARVALENFARGLNFDLTGEEEPEFENGRWLPVATVRNITRILFAFFTEKQNACVAYV